MCGGDGLRVVSHVVCYSIPEYCPVTGLRGLLHGAGVSEECVGGDGLRVVSHVVCYSIPEYCPVLQDYAGFFTALG